MAFKFAEIFGKAGLETPIEKNQVYAVKVMPLFKKTNIRLFNSDNINPNKPRPIIICKIAQNIIEFIALSTTDNYFVMTKKERKKVDLRNCSLPEEKEKCFFIKFKKEAFIFVRGSREKFYMNKKILKELLDEYKAKHCGKCENLGRLNTVEICG